jgi:hypothetical protein
MRNITLIGIGLLLISMTGCATVVRGDKQKLTFNTDPTGAKLVVGDKEYTTPAKVELKRREKYQVTVSKEGYRPLTFELTARWDGASLPAFAAPGGSASVATDRATGADLSYYKMEKIKLTPSTRPSEEPLKLIQHRGKLYTQEEYELVLKEEIRYGQDMSMGR